MGINNRTERLIIGGIALAAIIWALTTEHFAGLQFKLDYLIDLSSLFTVASFSARGMLPLRLLAVASSVAAIPYFMLQPTPLWTPVGWTALFMLINLYHIVRILLERRAVRLTPDEQRLYDLTFRRLAPREFLKLAKLGEWKSAQGGELLFDQGQKIERLVILLSGAVAASQDGAIIGHLQPGELIGEGIALTGQVSLYRAELTTDSRYIAWQVDAIDRFQTENLDLHIKINDIINHQLVAQINKLALSVHRQAA
ncbi:MAG: cyclic nucleotide-binding domain-containing protein [Thiohalocapsa sp. PB-PSB1]|jgi:CRP-like cAMP-binding protein|nr:MAG: cyclic nucleotide-binding domain-containing protein [Thiohalocapsa sp. PB-PSB1]